MDKDKEYLLPVEATDSDDIVEEFKLPPPRTRRPKARKALAEARIAASSSSLLSWKCCLMFIIATIFIAGVLVLAFFMLNMQSEIHRLSRNSAEAKMQIQPLDSLQRSTKKVMDKLEEYKEKFSKQDLNLKLLAHQIAVMNKTLQKITSSNELQRQVKKLASDVDSLKTGMASTGGSIDKIHSEIEQHEDRFDSVLTELKNVKIAMYNSSTKNKTLLKKLTRPISAQTQEIRRLKVLIRKVNNSLESNTQRISQELYKRNFEMGDKIKKLEIAVDTVNSTHVDKSMKMAKLFSSYKNESAANLASYATGVNFLMNLTGNINKKVQHHHKLLANYTDLVNDVKKCKNMSITNQKDIKAMDVKVAKHHDLMNKQVNSSLAYIKDILRLQNISKTSEEMINIHHQKLNDYMKKINLLGSSVKTTVIPINIESAKMKQKNQSGSKKSKLVAKTTTTATPIVTETIASTTLQPAAGETKDAATLPPVVGETKDAATQRSTADKIKATETLQPAAAETKDTTTQQPAVAETTATATQTVAKITATTKQYNTSLPTPGSHHLDTDGKGARKHKDGCPIECEKTEQCNKTRKGYKCICKEGFTKIGKYCEDVNECSMKSHNCHSNALCINSYGSFACVCKDGFRGNGTYCVSDNEHLKSGTESLGNTSITKAQPVTRPNANASSVATGLDLIASVGVAVSGTKPTGPVASPGTNDGNITRAKFNVTSTVAPKEIGFGAVTTNQGYTSTEPNAMTPEMPDERGRFDDDQATIAEQDAKKEIHKLYKVPMHFQRRGKHNGVKQDFLNKIDRDDKRKKDDKRKEWIHRLG